MIQLNIINKLLYNKKNFYRKKTIMIQLYYIYFIYIYI